MVERTLLETVLKPFEIFLLLVLIGVGVFNSNQPPLINIAATNLEIACSHGGFTTDDINRLKDNLNKNGYDVSNVTITIEPSEAINSTDTTYASRGEEISLEITNNKLGLIDTLYKKLGSTDDIKNHIHLYGMSEGVRK